MAFSPHLFVSHVIDSPRFLSIFMKSWLAQGSWRVSLKRGVRAGTGIDRRACSSNQQYASLGNSNSQFNTRYILSGGLIKLQEFLINSIEVFFS